jgi:hypothetical protein
MRTTAPCLRSVGFPACRRPTCHVVWIERYRRREAEGSISRHVEDPFAVTARRLSHNAGRLSQCDTWRGGLRTRTPSHRRRLPLNRNRKRRIARLAANFGAVGSDLRPYSPKFALDAPNRGYQLVTTGESDPPDSGSRPWSLALATPAVNTAGNATAPTAPHRAVATGTSRPATASSATGTSTPSGAVRATGKPNPGQRLPGTRAVSQLRRPGDEKRTSAKGFGPLIATAGGEAPTLTP